MSRAFSEGAPVVGRLAPSPTGAQHVGNARTFLIAWLAARSRGGRIILRIEDIDSPRVKPGAAQWAIDDLRWLGLDWDEGPDCGGPHGPYFQTERYALYKQALKRLQEAEKVYPCTCSRSDVAAAASAPHAGQDAPVYPGTCAHRCAADADQCGRPYAWRFRVPHRPLALRDQYKGPCCCDPARDLGDFVIARSDHSPSYQLAVVVDDHTMGVTHVVRGDDLLPSAFRQTLLYEFFGWQVPQWYHVPLVVGPDGRRLAKRHGDTRIARLRELHVSAARLLGLLAWSCGWIERPEPVSLDDLLQVFSWETIPSRPWVFTEQDWSWLVNGK